MGDLPDGAGRPPEFCSPDCRDTGKDLMPEVIEALLAERERARRAGRLPRLFLTEEDTQGRRPSGVGGGAWVTLMQPGLGL